jgi:hypothetical protein
MKLCDPRTAPAPPVARPGFGTLGWQLSNKYYTDCRNSWKGRDGNFWVVSDAVPVTPQSQYVAIDQDETRPSLLKLVFPPHAALGPHQAIICSFTCAEQGRSGSGLATARQFVNEGAHVFITGRRDPELTAAVKEIGRNVTAVQEGAAAAAGRPELSYGASDFPLTHSNDAELEFQSGHACSAAKKEKSGAPDTIRTCDLCLRRATLYPAELRVRCG